jgi:hypothetical protein
MTKEESIAAISIRQPWAELILRGKKKIEIRNWDSTYRGKLYLHAGRVPDEYKALDLGLQDAFRGGYIGIIELAAIIPLNPELWEQWRELHLSMAPFRAGFFAWMLRNPVRFTNPIPAPGKLGIYYPDPEIANILKHTPFSINAQNNSNI